MVRMTSKSGKATGSATRPANDHTIAEFTTASNFAIHRTPRRLTVLFHQTSKTLAPVERRHFQNLDSRRETPVLTLYLLVKRPATRYSPVDTDVPRSAMSVIVASAS